MNFTNYSIISNSSTNSKTVDVFLSYINFPIYKSLEMDNFSIICGFHEKENIPVVLINYEEFKVNLSGNSIVLNTSTTNMNYFSCLLYYNNNHSYISNYTISISQIDFDMKTYFNRNATHLNGEIEINYIDWPSCENDSISITTSLKCNYFHYIPTNDTSFDSIENREINCNKTDFFISTKSMDYEYFSCMLNVNNKTIIHTDEVPSPSINISI